VQLHGLHVSRAGSEQGPVLLTAPTVTACYIGNDRRDFLSAKSMILFYRILSF